MMPKQDDAIVPDPDVCDGCGREWEWALDDVFVEPQTGHMFCPDCAERRKDDPPVTIHGRTLLLSELTAQAWDGDVDLKAALDGDTVQDQITAAKKR